MFLRLAVAAEAVVEVVGRASLAAAPPAIGAAVRAGAIWLRVVALFIVIGLIVIVSASPSSIAVGSGPDDIALNRPRCRIWLGQVVLLVCRCRRDYLALVRLVSDWSGLVVLLVVGAAGMTLPWWGGVGLVGQVVLLVVGAAGMTLPWWGGVGLVGQVVLLVVGAAGMTLPWWGGVGLVGQVVLLVVGAAGMTLSRWGLVLRVLILLIFLLLVVLVVWLFAVGAVGVSLAGRSRFWGRRCVGVVDVFVPALLASEGVI